MKLTRQSNSLEDATRRAQEQIQAVRHRAQKELERATKQADRALHKSSKEEQKYSMWLGAVIGTAALGGAAAWLLNRRRS